MPPLRPIGLDERTPKGDINKGVWNQKPERFCPECKSIGITQFLGDDCICTKHGLVAPVYGELEEHMPDRPGRQVISTASKRDKSKKKQQKEKEELIDKKYQSEEIKMMSDPFTFDGDNPHADNSNVEQTWLDLEGDD